MAKKPRARKSKPPKFTAHTAVESLLGSNAVAEAVSAFEPEPDDRPIGDLTDAQLGAVLRMICARGHGALVFRYQGQLFLRVIAADSEPPLERR